MTSRSTRTIEDYRRRVDQIRRQTAAHLGYEHPHLVPPLSLVEHLLDRKHASAELTEGRKRKGRPSNARKALADRAISRATWRQYRAALLFVLEEEHSTAIEGVVLEELAIAIRTLRSETQAGCLRTTSRTSGNKLKGFPDADFQRIEAYLEASIRSGAPPSDHAVIPSRKRGRDRPHKRAATLLTWLRAGRIAGARPSEWRSAGLIEIDGVPALRFGNAKVTNGRGNGEQRHLLLDLATPEDLGHLDDMLYMLVEQEKTPGYDFDAELRRLSLYMRYVTRKCLGERPAYPTLYSLRHQFAADLKGPGTYSQSQVAALMGHGSTATAATHYGRKTSSQRAPKVNPVLAEVATVRQGKGRLFDRTKRPQNTRKSG
ncbi:MAG: hypothetical protein EPN79_15915 [Burkholderiaceae bacterium]|nr:MAG: hypothetical protein EPN79_15915 [Burkholderiaceae bacterium]